MKSVVPEIVDQFVTCYGDVLRVDFDGTLMVADSDGAIAQIMLTDLERERLSQAIRRMTPSAFYSEATTDKARPEELRYCCWPGCMARTAEPGPEDPLGSYCRSHRSTGRT